MLVAGFVVTTGVVVVVVAGPGPVVRFPSMEYARNATIRTPNMMIIFRVLVFIS